MNTWRSAAMVFLFVPLVWGAPGLAGAAGVEKKSAFPRPLGYVSDYAELIDADWQSRIRAVCKELEDRTGVEMIVVTIETASPHSHAREYAEGLYKEWH
ncbi:MAG: TPM domain-containing protein, partial [Nitrospira sp. SB0666_bin_27]|nr:TPM domain-containing protein [Nitrospira sp. SB0666_bin_27]